MVAVQGCAEEPRVKKSVAAFGACVVLTGCGGGEATEPAAADTPTLPPARTTETTAVTSTEEPGPETNDRGNIVKAIGEEGGISDLATDDAVLTFAVDGIAAAQCEPDWQEYGSGPENGHLTAVDMRVATAPAFGTSDLGSYFTITPYDFQFIDPAGITHTNLETMATYGCVSDAQSFTQDPLSPASQYVGKIVLDLPAPNGTLVYRPSSVVDGGWEWSF